MIEKLSIFNERPGISPAASTVDKAPALKFAPADTKLAARLHEMAAKTQTQADDKLSDRLQNTPKRQAEAGRARCEGYHLERTAEALRNLAEMWEAGNVPEVLAKTKTKKAIHELTRAEIICGTGYYDAPNDTGKRYHDSPEALAVWAILEQANAHDADQRKRADELRERVNVLQFAKIPGYFPTPPAVVARMLDLAEHDREIGCTTNILEPSAGSAAILDGISERWGDFTIKDNGSPFVVAMEIWPSLCDILKLKGFASKPVDFLELRPGQFLYDLVLMNPPFENRQDAAHVMHAYNFLKPGGRLVAVMSPGPFSDSRKAGQAFRGWFENLAMRGLTYSEDLPAGSFKASGTGVSTLLITIDKPE